ncbi:unnamed protein product [Protopolystoma xenopodis]|uniref:Uncharacterized protein n=1 Tax=Protopolystoma xenopodis TaxID=117903 RepID=A0A448WKR9_9PLAT|nr:unnamed protein product [Protopolystoma xenopodis]
MQIRQSEGKTPSFLCTLWATEVSDACCRKSSPAVRYPIYPHAALTVAPLTHARQDDMRSKVPFYAVAFSHPISSLAHRPFMLHTYTPQAPCPGIDVLALRPLVQACQIGLQPDQPDDTLPQSSNNELPRPTTAESPEAWLSEVAVSLTASPSTF